MIPSGSVNSGVPAFGVLHPPSQSPVGGPLVAGGTIGRAGGVGDSTGDPGGVGVNGAIDDGVDGAEDVGSDPSHATNNSTDMQTNSGMWNLRKRNAPGRRDPVEDTHSPDPW